MTDCIRAASLLALAVTFAAPAWADTVTVKSPNGRNAVSIDSDQLTYSVSRDGKRIIEPSPLGLNLDIGAIGPGAKLGGHAETSVNDTYEIVLGKARSAPDHYQQSTLSFAGKPQFQLIVRAYDDGVAVRYVVPEQAGVAGFKVMNEATQFNFAKDYDCWGANMGRFDTSFEAEYDRTKASASATSTTTWRRWCARPAPAPPPSPSPNRTSRTIPGSTCPAVAMRVWA